MTVKVPAVIPSTLKIIPSNGPGVASSHSPTIEEKPFTDSSTVSMGSSSSASLEGRDGSKQLVGGMSTPVIVETAVGLLDRLSISGNDSSSTMKSKNSTTRTNETENSSEESARADSPEPLHACAAADMLSLPPYSVVEGIEYASLATEASVQCEVPCFSRRHQKKSWFPLRQQRQKTRRGKRQSAGRMERPKKKQKVIAKPPVVRKTPARKPPPVDSSIPKSKSANRHIYNRLQNLDSLLCPGNLSFNSRRDAAYYVLYRWIRTRLGAGMIRSSIVRLQEMLTKGYDEAGALLQKVEDDEHSDCLHQLVELRRKLAAVWCIYAHVIMEVGHKALDETRDTITIHKPKALLRDDNKETPRRIDPTPKKKRGRPPKESNSSRSGKKPPCSSPKPRERRKWSAPVGLRTPGATPLRTLKSPKGPKQTSSQLTRKAQKQDDNAPINFDDIYNHAITILLSARNCPLVRDSSLISLSLGRLIVSGAAFKSSKTGKTVQEISSERLLAAVSSAISACWDAVDICQSKHNVPKRFQIQKGPGKSIELISKHEFTCRPVHKEVRVSDEHLKLSMPSVLELPDKLVERIGSTSTIFCDRNTIRELCTELNRLSRLKEHITEDKGLTIAPLEGDTLLDGLKLFAAFDTYVEKPDSRSCYSEVEYVAKEYATEKYPRTRTLLWNWS